jgi:hypothetical protein
MSARCHTCSSRYELPLDESSSMLLTVYSMSSEKCTADSCHHDTLHPSFELGLELQCRCGVHFLSWEIHTCLFENTPVNSVRDYSLHPLTYPGYLHHVKHASHLSYYDQPVVHFTFVSRITMYRVLSNLHRSIATSRRARHEAVANRRDPREAHLGIV